MSRVTQIFRSFDWVLFGSVILLAVFGLVALYSTSLGGVSQPDAAVFDGQFGNFWKQVVFVGMGLLLSLIVASIDYGILRRFAGVLFWLAVALLVAVLLFGKTIRGTTGWFSIGGFGLQPVEVAKVFLIVYIGRCFAFGADRHEQWRVFLKTGLATLVLFTLVALQPDFGSAFLLFVIWVGVLLTSKVGKGYLAILAVAVAVVTAVAWIFLLKPYQKDRVAVFLDPSRDPLGRGYNVTQSVIAIGSGGVMGKGLGFGSQSQLRFLPERQTDFLFAVIAEELGFFGVMLLLILFSIFFFRAYLLLRQTDDPFAVFIIVGIVASIITEVCINIGSNLRLVPVTGVTLPFLSYGGSSLIAKFFMVGLLESIALRSRPVHNFH